ncbi:indolepyruvate ferredoxin oxidoreductase beta subunit [Malonomonas rubra DSM 5091]|uniref:Indolepyruvate ferredoxin oxidoreductase beta subunit n=1 Tax=Malonomonas rubra DSM 5091 TaxID=1122189 RepID=A0A1M6B7H5_MALRU|nr:indolepyruvate oxidoreductase subunit beta [Malonomonas rubra]SHI44665.1 indolepyruvate ferredoxin oxidoreductase beta subunit [Malonomonas rubra DSM 5091]
MSDVKNILLAGVGGQGILLASEVLSEVMMMAGMDVKKNEIHGMSQRGGSVTSHVRYGEKVYSSIIPEGEVDILFSFELLEAKRYLPLLRKEGQVIVNNLKIAPPSVALGKQVYPENLADEIGKQFPATKVINGLDLALEAGNPKTVNTVLLGALSKVLDVDYQLWIDALNKMVPAKLLDINLNAFELGRNAV